MVAVPPRYEALPFQAIDRSLSGMGARAAQVSTSAIDRMFAEETITMNARTPPCPLALAIALAVSGIPAVPTLAAGALEEIVELMAPLLVPDRIIADAPPPLPEERPTLPPAKETVEPAPA